jgi:hypothetical protein
MMTSTILRRKTLHVVVLCPVNDLLAVLIRDIRSWEIPSLKGICTHDQPRALKLKQVTHSDCGRDGHDYCLV